MIAIISSCFSYYEWIYSERRNDGLDLLIFCEYEMFHFFFCRCVGPLNAAKLNQCSGPASKEATIDPSLGKTLFRFRPLAGEEGTYRIILKDRPLKKGCNRFLSANGDCSINTVSFARDDYGGLQRWVITKVDPNGDITAAPLPPLPTQSPTPVATSTPSPTPSLPPVPAPSIDVSEVSFAAATLSVSFSTDFSVRSCTVNLSPGGHYKSISDLDDQNAGSTSFSDLIPNTAYTATVSCELNNGIWSPESEVSFTTQGGTYSDNPNEFSDSCDGRGEIIDENGMCICSRTDTIDGPFVPRENGGCKCPEGYIDNGNGPCECPSPSTKGNDGLCRCPILFEACDSVCCPCMKYSQVIELRPSDSEFNQPWGFGNGASMQTVSATAMNELGDRVFIADYASYDTDENSIAKVYIYTEEGPSWTEERIPLSPDQGTDVTSLATNAAGDMFVLGSYMVETNTDKGKVYVYRIENGAWVLKQSIVGDGATKSFGWGVSLSADGQWLTVGDPLAEFEGVAVGKVYVYKAKRNGVFELQSSWYASDKGGSTPHYFGEGFLSGDGSVLAVRDSYRKVTAPGQKPIDPKVYLYKWTGAQWEEIQIIKKTGETYWGRNVALNYEGDVMTIGWGEDPVSQHNIEYYKFNGSLWEYQETIVPSEMGSHGHSMALNKAGDILVSGDWYREKIYVFRYIESSWNEVGTLTIADRPFYFGWKVVMSGSGDRIGTVDHIDYVEGDPENYMGRYTQFQNTCGDLF